MSTLPFDLQPTHLQSEWVKLRPLTEDDFERLYAVAADPLIWEQHPQPDRYQLPVFEAYFAGALQSEGAFIILDSLTANTMGSSRYYDYDPKRSVILIGYTFLARSCWGKPYNAAMKSLMLNHAFEFVDNVQFQIGANNVRSQKAIAKLGATQIAEEATAQPDGQVTRNFRYQITREDWKRR